MEGPKAKAQSSMATTTTEEDTRPKVLIRGWRKVLDSYPKDASGQLERDQQFINELSKQPVAKFRVACQLNTNLVAKPKCTNTKMTSFTSVHCATTCSGCMFCRLFASLHFPPPICCTNFRAYTHAIILASSQCLGGL